METEIKKLHERLSETRKQIREHNDVLSELRTEERSIAIDIYKFESGLDINDIVSFKDGRQTKTGVIRGFVSKYGTVNPVVALHKSDGTVGLRTKDYFYNPLIKVS